VARDGKRIAVEAKLRSLRLKNMLSFLKSWKEVIIGGILIVNAHVFERLCRRLRPPPRYLASIGRAYLFAIGSALFYPSIFATLSLTILGLADRYAIEWLSTTSLVALNLAIIWGIVNVWTAEKWINVAIDGPDGAQHGRVGRLFTFAVIATAVVTFALLEVLIIAVTLWGPAALAAS